MIKYFSLFSRTRSSEGARRRAWRKGKFSRLVRQRTRHAIEKATRSDQNGATPCRRYVVGELGPYEPSEVASSLVTRPARTAFGSRRLTLARRRVGCRLVCVSLLSSCVRSSNSFRGTTPFLSGVALDTVEASEYR